MSKAFTREEDVSGPEVLRRPVSTLPPGARNYVTADGARRLRAELDHLVSTERPRAVAAGRELNALDQRIAQLSESLRTAVVVDPPATPDDRVRFGATVTVRDRGGEETRYRIVGVDETDVDRGWVSWLSPVAKALLNARSGDRVRLKLPGGGKELEIIAVVYQ